MLAVKVNDAGAAIAAWCRRPLASPLGLNGRCMAEISSLGKYEIRCESAAVMGVDEEGHDPFIKRVSTENDPR
jgi:hypothetical protein